MAGFWELWDLESANAIWDFESEAEALACVRELPGQGWRTDQLVMIFGDPALADEALPPGVTVDELARRVEAIGPDSS